MNLKLAEIEFHMETDQESFLDWLVAIVIQSEYCIKVTTIFEADKMFWYRRAPSVGCKFWNLQFYFLEYLLN